MRKGFLIALLSLAGILLLGGVYGYWQLKKSLPPVQGERALRALNSTVTVYRDSMGIPQIFAKNEHDAYFALGYLHAADRLFQMDLTRRVAQGRLSEFFGSVTLNIDRYQRMIGHNRLAKKFLSHLQPADRARLQAYADGVNNYVQTCSALPFEYRLLGMEFEPYTLTDILSILSFQTWFSNFLLSSDVWFLKIFDQWGAERTKSLDLPYPAWAPVTVPQEKEISWRGWLFNTFFADGFIPWRMAHSSNSWVIAPGKSASGHAMLASDPHLETRRLPQFWYMVGLHVEDPKTDVLGITTPGIPFVVMGHNGQAAWAFTVGGIDVTEIYIEKRNPEDSTLYWNGKEWVKFTVQTDTIRIKGSDQPEVFTFKRTGNGPVIWTTDSLNNDYSLHWAGFDVDLAHTVQAAFRLHRVNNFDDFRKFVTSFGALDANWTYADKNGNIGYQLGTPIPVRPKSVKGLPIPGWIDSLKWRGFHPLNETPHNYNPKRGWLATCNNKQDVSHLNYTLRGKFAADRIIRITELLSGQNTFTVHDMQRFQQDRVDRMLQRWQPTLINLLKEQHYEHAARLLEKWDGSVSMDSRAAALVILFKTRLRHLIFDDELGKQARFLTDEALLDIFENGPEVWFDNVRTKDRVETRDELAVSALQWAVKTWNEEPWGNFQTLKMEHPFARVPGLATLLSLRHGPIPWGGTQGSLNASFYEEDPNKPGTFHSIVGPSWRFVIDFADPDQATFVLPAGNSGNPASPFFFNFFEWWAKGKRWNVPISLAKVKARAVYVLKIQPTRP